MGQGADDRGVLRGEVAVGNWAKIRQDGVVKFIGIIFCFVELCSETPEK